MKQSIKKRLVAFLMAACMLALLAPPAMAEEPAAAGSGTAQPRYIGLSEMYISFNITSLGRADCYSYAMMEPDYTGDLTMHLQRSTNQKTWFNVKTWTSEEGEEAELEESYYVVPGYYYRVQAKVHT